MRERCLIHNGRRLAPGVLACESFLERARGLALARRWRAPAIVKIAPCAGVHTFGLRGPIDVVFTNRSGRVLRCVHRLQPWRIAVCGGALAAWEMPPGLCGTLCIEPGDRLDDQPLRA
ncbi:MAG: hypothetical protein NAOJABEB_01418 [Steroidobacteraceae bacterium]|nr:hypothetical protein [Steroidobacteraceae bacterium]